MPSLVQRYRIASVLLFLAMLNVIVIAGVLGAVFIYRKKMKTKNDSVYTAGGGACVIALHLNS